MVWTVLYICTDVKREEMRKEIEVSIVVKISVRISMTMTTVKKWLS